MRETRLLDYGESAAVNLYKQADIVISLGGAHSQQLVYGRWAGLIDGATSWRVEGGQAIILENALSGTGLILKFSSPLTCTPLFRKTSNESGAFIEVLASCFSGRSGCTLVRVRATISSETSEEETSFFQEISRCIYDPSWVTSVTEVSGDVIVGCADGRCAQVVFQTERPDGMQVVTFATQPPTASNSQHHGENTSMVSAASMDTGASRRSVGSSMSLGLMTRFFGSPRGTGAGNQAVEASSVENSYYQRFARRGVDRRGSVAQPIDRVFSVTAVLLDMKAVASLHESGRVCVYAFKGGRYQFIGDIILPVKLASSSIDHFLLTGLRESILAAVMVDEDPHADSLQVFNITAKLDSNSAVSLSSIPIVKREGPIDRVVSTVFTGEDIIIATETGLISGLLNVPDEEGTSSGLPSGTLWTAVDDVDQPFGFGQVLEDVFPDIRFQLLCAHRFSVGTIAKALRLDNAGTISRNALVLAVKETSFEDDEETSWKRVLARAKQICKTEQLQIRNVSIVDGIGVVVARQESVFALRELLEAEKVSLPRDLRLLGKKGVVSNSEASALLSSHSAAQTLAAQYKAQSESGNESPRLKFMLKTSVSFSSMSPYVPLTGRLAVRYLQNRVVEAAAAGQLSSAVSWMMNELEPGSKLLSLLHGASEIELLKEAVEFSAEKLPVSSMFATGLSWLSQYKEFVSEKESIDEEGMDSLTVRVDPPSALLDQAYGCLVTAAEWCKRGLADSDVECVMSLAGLLDAAAGSQDDAMRDTEQQEIQEDVEMTMSDHRLPNGPDSRIVRQHLGFWLLERSVRLLESSGAPKSAAAAALEAMALAPDRRRHEMMRAAAFSRFLDAAELEHALTAILNRPYEGEVSAQTQVEESAALRDAIGLFVNAVAEHGSLKWLSEYQLPEPLHALCGLALERRARAADALQQCHLTPERSSDMIGDMLDSKESPHEVRSQCEYEQLYAWHIMRGDETSAASAALEWGERLSKEGLSAVQSIISNKSKYVSPKHQLMILLRWAKMKCDAWSYASSSAEMQGGEWKYIIRSRYSLLTNDSSNGERGTVDLSWVSRRHLLALAQCRCLTEMLSEDDQEGTLEQRIGYLMNQNSVLLGEQREGVRWVVNVLMKDPSQSDMLLCSELATSWVPEIGDGPLKEVVQVAAGAAAQRSKSTFGYPELQELLQSIILTDGKVGLSRNWNLLALESSLATSSGAIASPQWLINAAAWGMDGFTEGESITEREFVGQKRGDAAGAVRTLLRNNRPVDAAKVLLAGLTGFQEQAGLGKEKAVYVPYSAIDSTLEMLTQLAADYPEAERYQKLLTESTRSHIEKMEKASSSPQVAV